MDNRVKRIKMDDVANNANIILCDLPDEIISHTLSFCTSYEIALLNRVRSDFLSR